MGNTISNVNQKIVSYRYSLSQNMKASEFDCSFWSWSLPISFNSKSKTSRINIIDATKKVITTNICHHKKYIASFSHYTYKVKLSFEFTSDHLESMYSHRLYVVITDGKRLVASQSFPFYLNVNLPVNSHFILKHSPEQSDKLYFVSSNDVAYSLPLNPDKFVTSIEIFIKETIKYTSSCYHHSPVKISSPSIVYCYNLSSRSPICTSHIHSLHPSVSPSPVSTISFPITPVDHSPEPLPEITSPSSPLHQFPYYGSADQKSIMTSSLNCFDLIIEDPPSFVL
jgi:hypothetical protein